MQISYTVMSTPRTNSTFAYNNNNNNNNNNNTVSYTAMKSEDIEAQIFC